MTQRAGSAAAPITLTGPSERRPWSTRVPQAPRPPARPMEADGNSGYGLWLYDAPHWKLTGFTVKDSKKGIVLDNSHHVTIDGVYVHHVEDEAVHFRRSSADVGDPELPHHAHRTGPARLRRGGVHRLGRLHNWGWPRQLGRRRPLRPRQGAEQPARPQVTAEHVDVRRAPSTA
ncbi:right-handed parallel beta-helix repeat-containing protein [Nonomuraea dietziae]|uniref:right-handed parallel beta-helix repeat-containing protein n=1 Tax=Nonomuraea dietziae TaxID=65515 RepID=UPI0031CF8134